MFFKMFRVGKDVMNDLSPHRLELFMVPFLLVLIVSCTGKPSETQLLDGKLRPCPDRPNCVSSEEIKAPAQVEPLSFQGPPDVAWARIKETIRYAGGEIEQEGDTYLRATFASRLFRFVDDVELRMDAAENHIHIRSASRLGYSDLGVNRKRVEKLRDLFQRRKPPPP